MGAALDDAPFSLWAGSQQVADDMLGGNWSVTSDVSDTVYTRNLNGIATETLELRPLSPGDPSYLSFPAVRLQKH